MDEIKKVLLIDPDGESLHPETEVAQITDLKANPTGEVTGTLSKLQIGEDIYSLDIDISGKADKTYVDAQDAALASNIATKASTEYVDTAVNDAANIAQTYIDIKIDDVEEDVSAAYDAANDATNIASAAYNAANAGVKTADVINDITHTDINKPLSANMGKELQDQINNLKAIGRYLSGWDCTTGLPTTNPTENPYTYKTGDYYIVTKVGDTNYKPNGTSYDQTASTTVETNEVKVGDYYRFDSTVWKIEINTQRTVSFENIAGQPTQNSNLAAALNAKQDLLVSGENIKTINNQSILGSGNIEIQGGSGLPEGGNNGDVPTKVITSTVIALRDSYTVEEFESFYGDLALGEYKGIYREGYYSLDLYCNTNEDDGSKYYKFFYRINSNYYTYALNYHSGGGDGWWDLSGDTVQLDHAPTLTIPKDISEDDYCNISDISEMNVLLDITAAENKIEWKPGIPSGGKNGQVLTKVVKDVIQDHYDEATLEEWYKKFDPSLDLTTGNSYGMISAYDPNNRFNPFGISIANDSETETLYIRMGLDNNDDWYDCLYFTAKLAEYAGFEEGWNYLDNDSGQMIKIPSISEFILTILPENYLNNPDWEYQTMVNAYADGTYPKIEDFKTDKMEWNDAGIDVSKVTESSIVAVTVESKTEWKGSYDQVPVPTSPIASFYLNNTLSCEEIHKALEKLYNELYYYGTGDIVIAEGAILQINSYWGPTNYWFDVWAGASTIIDGEEIEVRSISPDYDYDSYHGDESSGEYYKNGGKGWKISDGNNEYKVSDDVINIYWDGNGVWLSNEYLNIAPSFTNILSFWKDFDKSNVVVPGTQKLEYIGGGNPGDVLTKVVSQDVTRLKDNYTYDELAAFHNNRGGYVGLYQYGGLRLDVEYKSTSGGTWYWLRYTTASGDSFIYITGDSYGNPAGWYNNDENPCDTPEFDWPEDWKTTVTHYDLENIDSADELDVLFEIQKGCDFAWAPASGSGVPAGGTEGQVLTKLSDEDGAAEWQDINALPEGGSEGQVLIKVSDEQGDAEWGNPQIGAMMIQTTAPTEDNAHGLIMVVLNEEPEAYYNGYIYVIEGITQ